MPIFDISNLKNQCWAINKLIDMSMKASSTIVTGYYTDLIFSLHSPPAEYAFK